METRIAFDGGDDGRNGTEDGAVVLRNEFEVVQL
jgi:hypothetical protein